MLDRLHDGLCDLAGFVGCGCVAYGAWLVYHPAGFIVGGLMLVAGAAYYGSTLEDRKLKGRRK